MTIQHNTITDPEIHEPKGVAAASSGTVYKADGTGSGSWSYPLTGLNTASSGQVFVSDGSASGTWKYSPAKPHAEIYISGGTTAHTLSSTADTYTKINPSGEWTASGYEDILSVDATNGEIDLSLDGHYLLNFWINFTTSAIAGGSVYKFKYALDGTTAARTITVPKFSNGADTLHSAASGLLEVTGGSTVPLSLHVAGDATSAGEDITVVEAGLTVLFLD